MNKNNAVIGDEEAVGPSVDYIQVEAPCDLPAGYVLQIDYGNRQPYVTVVRFLLWVRQRMDVNWVHWVYFINTNWIVLLLWFG